MPELRVVIVEDSRLDAQLLSLTLKKLGYDLSWERAETEQQFLALLDPQPDLILADFHMPDFGALPALQLLNERQLDIPVIVVSGMIGEELAVECIKQGAADYLLKDRLARLGHAVDRALSQRRLRLERQQAEDELRITNRKLQEALAARDDFLAAAAHELKTPLTSLRGFVQLLSRRSPDEHVSEVPRVRSSLHAIEKESVRLAGLVDRLFDVSLIDTGKLRLEPEEVDLAALTRSLVQRYQLIADGHRFVVGGPERVPVWADPLRTEEVVANLIDNAIKFSPIGSEIGLLLGQMGDLGQLTIADHGIGVPIERREHMFERFFQAHEDEHRSGMGLGLYICKHLLEAQGGTIQAIFPADGGTQFIVTLPAKV